MIGDTEHMLLLNPENLIYRFPGYESFFCLDSFNAIKRSLSVADCNSSISRQLNLLSIHLLCIVGKPAGPSENSDTPLSAHIRESILFNSVTKVQFLLTHRRADGVVI